MSESTEQSKKKTRKSPVNRKPRQKLERVNLDESALSQALQSIGGTPTWISSAGSMDDASTWKPQSPGEELVGVHAGVEDRGQNQKYYKVAVPDTTQEKGYRIETTKATMGNKRMDNIQTGKPVRIVYNGIAETKGKTPEGKAKTYKDYTVFQTAV